MVAMPVKRTDFTPCIEAIKQLSNIASDEENASKQQDLELTNLMQNSENIAETLSRIPISAPATNTSMLKTDIPQLDTPEVADSVEVNNLIKKIEEAGKPINFSSSPVEETNYGMHLLSALNSFNEKSKTILENIPKNEVIHGIPNLHKGERRSIGDKQSSKHSYCDREMNEESDKNNGKMPVLPEFTNGKEKTNEANTPLELKKDTKNSQQEELKHGEESKGKGDFTKTSLSNSDQNTNDSSGNHNANNHKECVHENHSTSNYNQETPSYSYQRSKRSENKGFDSSGSSSDSSDSEEEDNHNEQTWTYSPDDKKNENSENDGKTESDDQSASNDHKNNSDSDSQHGNANGHTDSEFWFSQNSSTPIITSSSSDDEQTSKKLIKPNEKKNSLSGNTRTRVDTGNEKNNSLLSQLVSENFDKQITTQQARPIRNVEKYGNEASLSLHQLVEFCI